MTQKCNKNGSLQASWYNYNMSVGEWGCGGNEFWGMSLNLALIIFLLIETIVTLEIRGLSHNSKNLLKSNFEFNIT